jgi:pilus assembly protein Flp/PilA
MYRGNGVNVVIQIFWLLLQDESGQDLVEYALVAALIGLGATAAMGTLASSIVTALSGIGSRLTSSV